VLIVLVPCISGCGLLYWRFHASGPIHAKVIDAKTNEPVRDADIKVIWEIERPRAFHGHDHEYFEQRAVTAADGSFDVPGWGPKFINGHIGANYPKITIIRAGNVQTTHANAWSGFGGGTICNDQFTTDTTEWWHGSVFINVTWNGCALVAYPDEASLAAAARLERIKSHTMFADGTFSSPSHGYLALFGDFISAKSIAELPSEAEIVRAAFCGKLIATYDKLTEAEKTSVAKYHGGFPPVTVDHGTYVLPYCMQAEQNRPHDAQQAVPGSTPPLRGGLSPLFPLPRALNRGVGQHERHAT
jgi:hypothetical protein